MVPVLSFAEKHKKKQKSEDSLDYDEEDNLYDKNKYEESVPRILTEDEIWSHETAQTKQKQPSIKVEGPNDKINIMGRQKNKELWITQ